MNRDAFNRRSFLHLAAGAAAAAGMPGLVRAEGKELRLWASAIAKVGAKDWSAMQARAGVTLAVTAKSARADEAVQKMVLGDGNKIFDALTDNGGGMEDALASQKAIAALNTEKIPNFKNILPVYHPGGAAADTIRFEGKVVAIPFISNADSMAYDYKALGFHPDSWGVLFDPEFKGRVALQNDFGPTLTTTAIYLQQSGKMAIKDPSDMMPDEVTGVCDFLIEHKKNGQFRTFWDGFQNGVDLLASGEVVMASCWEPVALVASKKTGDTADIRYGTMKEGHQTWNNVIMLTRGGRRRQMERAFYDLADVYLSPWFGALTLHTFGFAPQVVGVEEYMDANPKDFDEETRALLKARMAGKAERYAVKGNAWQNVFPVYLREYQDNWARLQAA